MALKVDEAPLVINAAFAQTLALKRSAGLETVACWQTDAQWEPELRDQLDALFAHRVLFATASAADARAGVGAADVRVLRPAARRRRAARAARLAGRAPAPAAPHGARELDDARGGASGRSSRRRSRCRSTATRIAVARGAQHARGAAASCAEPGAAARRAIGPAPSPPASALQSPAAVAPPSAGELARRDARRRRRYARAAERSTRARRACAWLAAARARARGRRSRRPTATCSPGSPAARCALTSQIHRRINPAAR